MEYAIQLNTSMPELAAIENAFLDIDPSAIVDMEPGTSNLRVSTNMLDSELMDALEQAGYPTPESHITRLPSVCCGSCSG